LSRLIENLALSDISQSFDLIKFDCLRPDINDFLHSDALNYQAQKLANTFVFHHPHQLEPIGFFSILTDGLNVKNVSSQDRNWFNRRIPNTKRLNHYPAIKLGRIGVAKEYQGTGFAYDLMDFIKVFAIRGLNPACRLLILDAINEQKQVNFYKRNQFTFLLESDSTNETRLMFYDFAM